MTVVRPSASVRRMTDWEIWACANEMRKQFGDDAPVQAAVRVDAMLEAEDREGYWVWVQILTRICKLGPDPDPNATRH